MPAAKKKTQNGHTKRAVITVRMTPTEKARLQRHCNRRGRKEGRTISFNQAVVDLIKAASH